MNKIKYYFKYYLLIKIKIRSCRRENILEDQCYVHNHLWLMILGLSHSMGVLGNVYPDMWWFFYTVIHFDHPYQVIYKSSVVVSWCTCGRIYRKVEVRQTHRTLDYIHSVVLSWCECGGFASPTSSPLWFC